MLGIDTEVKDQPNKPTPKPALDASSRGLDEEYDATDYMEVGCHLCKGHTCNSRCVCSQCFVLIGTV